MSFFIRKKNNLNKRLINHKKCLKRKPAIQVSSKKKTALDKSVNVSKAISSSAYDEEISSEDEFVSSDKESEFLNINETAQEKKLSLAKKYLEEIEKEERERLEGQDVDNSVIVHRLKEDVLEQAGKLKKKVAEKLLSITEENITVMRCKEHKLAITCIALSSDGKFAFSASKDCCIVKWNILMKSKVNCIRSKNHQKGENVEVNAHASVILSLAVSFDNKYLASGDGDNLIQIWNPESLQHLHTFKGHRGSVTGLAFCVDTNQLYSVSHDRTVKIWNLTEMCYIETLYGHQSQITGIDVLCKDRAVSSGGSDGSIRVWKVQEESQLIFNGHERSIDMVKRLDNQHFVSCGADGQLCVWGALKKKPLCVIPKAHGIEESTKEPNWISSVSALPNADIFASGSSDGFLRLWKCGEGFRTFSALFAIPMTGFINALAFTADGKHIVLGLGQEHRLGRWSKIKEAKNSLIVIALRTKVT